MRSRLGQGLPFMLAFTVPLAIVLVPGSVLGQSNYVFNSGGVTSTATSMSNGIYGKGYGVSGTCNGTTCTGGLSPSGFKDNGHSSIDTITPSGEIASLADGTTQNATTATTGGLVHLSISSSASSLAEGNYNPGWASSAEIYKPPTWHDGTGMFMAWNVYIASTLTVSNLKGSQYKVENGGTAFADAGWNITVETPSGTILATYDQQTNGTSFTAQIPANTIVTIGWHAITSAKAECGWFSAASASGSASVTGTVIIGP